MREEFTRYRNYKIKREIKRERALRESLRVILIKHLKAFL